MTQAHPVRRLLLATMAAVTLTLGTAFAGAPASAAPATGTVLSAGGPGALSGQYLVVLKDNATLRSQGVPTLARQLTARHNGTLGFTYQKALHGFSVRMNEQQARQLAADPAVATVEQDHTVHIATTQPNPPSWGLDRIDQRNLPLDNSYTFNTTASNVHAYVIDTGVRITHTTFGGRASYGFDFIDNDATAQDGNGHGTHVSGTIGGTEYGVAKGVQIVGVRVLNNAGSGTTAQVVAGIDWVTQNAIKPAVANMSLGGGADATLDNAVSNSIASGVTYAIAAGNGDALGNPLDACTQSPARVPTAITVGATQQNDQRASFSNTGTCLDIFAPGVGITSSWNASDTATNTISGTSMATPHVAGAAALVLAGSPGSTPQQVRDTLVNNATPNVVGNPGTGSPNRLLFTGSTTPPTNDFSISASPASGSVAAGGSVTSTISTAVTAGSAQTVNLSASGLPSGATASFSPTSVTSGGSATLTISTTASTPGGTYPVTVTGAGSGATHTTTFTLTVTGGTGSCTGTNGTDVSIPDAGAAVFSNITISGCNRNASATSQVEVHIVHTYRGDLVIDLVAPDGTTYRLKNSNGLDSADNVDTIFTGSLASEAANGTWRLRVQDVFSADTGFINSWTLRL